VLFRVGAPLHPGGHLQLLSEGLSMSLPQAGFKKEPGSTVRTFDIARNGATNCTSLSAAVTLGGEFGRRVDRIIDANILQINVDETFLADFRNRVEGGYIALGKFLDTSSACRRNERFAPGRSEAAPDSALLATQDADGYIGTVKDPEARIKALWDLHEGAYVVWALVTDYRYLDRRFAEGSGALGRFLRCKDDCRPESSP